MHIFFSRSTSGGSGSGGPSWGFKKKKEELRIGETLSDIIKDDRGSD